MANVSDDNKASRLSRIQAIVQEDYDRVQGSSDPYVVLNLPAGASASEVQDRYERYERFYRAENFQRLGDMDLTRKALDVRRSIGRAMVEIQTGISRADTKRVPQQATPEVPQIPSVAPDSASMADIYYRDGLTYLRLGDFNAAADNLLRATTYDPSKSIYLANLAYTRFKLNPTSLEVTSETGENLKQAVAMEPRNPEVLAIQARFGINTRDHKLAHEAIRVLEQVRPDHPRLKILKKRSKYDEN